MGVNFRDKYPRYLKAIEESIKGRPILYARIFQLPKEFADNQNRRELIKSILKILAPSTIRHLFKMFESCESFKLFFIPAVVPYSMLILDKKALYYRFGKYDDEVFSDDKIYKFTQEELLEENYIFLEGITLRNPPVSKEEFQYLIRELRTEMEDELKKMKSAMVKVTKSVTSVESEIFQSFKKGKTSENKEVYEQKLNEKLSRLYELRAKIRSKEKEISRVGAKSAG